MPPFTILSPISSDEEIMLNRRRGQLRGHLAHTFPGTAGEALRRVAAPYPSTACRFLEVSGTARRGVLPPEVPREDMTKHPAGPVKYLKYLRLKTLACYRYSSIPVFRYSRATQNLSSVFSTHVILRGPEEGHRRWTAHTRRSTGRSPR
jgi:hypothetical protein